MGFQFREKHFFKVFDILILIALGASLAFLASSLISVYIPTVHFSNDLKGSQSKKNQPNRKWDKLILSENIFNVDTGVSIKRKGSTTKIATAKAVSDIDGYKLIGFIRGNNPMALLKKGSKPVVIVTRKRGLKRLWYLYKIDAHGVYLKNKRTGEVKLFKFGKEESGGTQPVLTMMNGSYFKPNNANTSIEKVKIKREMLSKLGGFNSLFRQMSVVPVFKNGKAYGYRINFLSPVSILKKIGLRVGDVIVSVNGEPTTNPRALMGIYSELKEMNSISINLIRRSKKKTIFVEIE